MWHPSCIGVNAAECSREGVRLNQLTEEDQMKTIATAALAALLAFSAAPMFPAFAGEDLSAKIAAAKTAADHEALAAEFDKEAQEAEAEAAAHDKMAASYKGLGKPGAMHETHCAAIAKRARENAKDLKALADAERASAKAAK